MEYWIEVENGVSIYVEDINPEGKDTILFLHGWPLNHDAYEYQYNELPYAGFRCLGMDTRGFGKSSRPLNGYDYDRLAEDVNQVIQALNLDRITLAGHSMGGAIAARYMANYNQAHVKNLALFGAAIPSLIRRDNFQYGIPENTVNDLINETYENRPEMLNKLIDIFFFQFVTDSLANWFIDLGLKAAGYSTILCAMTFRDETLFNDLPKITVPTLILHGVHDKICPYALAFIMQEQIKNSRLIPFESSGHGLFFEEKKKFNQALIDFINKPSE